MSVLAADPIRDFCVAHVLRGENSNYHLYQEGEALPADYGSFAVYDGLDLIGAGSSRNLALTFDEYRSRLRSARIGIFIWAPDTDGSVLTWMEQSIDIDADEDEDDCPFCDGTGKRS